MSIKNHTPGEIRFFTYYLTFPRDKDQWVDQVAFVHPLDYQLKQTQFTDPQKEDLLRKGEIQWKDQNGVHHRVVVENVRRPKRWGVNHKAKAFVTQ